MVKQTTARKISRQLENIRKTYRRRALALEKASRLTMNMGESVEYKRAAESLRREASNISMENLRKYHEFRKAQDSTYMGTLSASAGMYMSSKKERIGYVPAQKPEEILKSETLSNIQYKYAGREIMVFTYGEVWDANDSPEARKQKVREEAARQLGVAPETLTTSQILSFYERAIREAYGDETFELRRDPLSEMVEGAKKYERNIEMGYSLYLENRGQ